MSVPIDEAFIERWAGIYAAKVVVMGEKAAREWFRSFVPKTEQARVFNAIQEGRRR